MKAWNKRIHETHKTKNTPLHHPPPGSLTMDLALWEATPELSLVVNARHNLEAEWWKGSKNVRKCSESFQFPQPCHVIIHQSPGTGKEVPCQQTGCPSHSGWPLTNKHWKTQKICTFTFSFWIQTCAFNLTLPPNFKICFNEIFLTRFSEKQYSFTWGFCMAERLYGAFKIHIACTSLY